MGAVLDEGVLGQEDGAALLHEGGQPAPQLGAAGVEGGREEGAALGRGGPLEEVRGLREALDELDLVGALDDLAAAGRAIRTAEPPMHCRLHMVSMDIMMQSGLTRSD